MNIYQVDTNQMDNYIKRLNKRKLIIYVILITVVFLIQYSIVYHLNNNAPFGIFIMLAIMISVAFYFGQSLENEKLKELSNGQFFIDNSVLKFQSSDNVTKEFKLDKIAVIHKKYSGTLIVKGDRPTKFNYIRPKKISPYRIGGINVIFIPSITSNYFDLVNNIMQASTKAMKLQAFNASN